MYEILFLVTGTGVRSYSGDGLPATSATFRCPYSVALDSLSNLYITDFDNQRVRKVSIATGIISTVAGICEDPLLIMQIVEFLFLLPFIYINGSVNILGL